MENYQSKTPIVIKLDDKSVQQNLFFFRSNFKIGRDEDCDIVINHGIVSRVHLEIFFDNGWKIKDNNSTNGTFLNGTRLSVVTALEKSGKIVLGEDGPVIYWEIQYLPSREPKMPIPGDTQVLPEQETTDDDATMIDFPDGTNVSPNFPAATPSFSGKMPSEPQFPQSAPPESPVLPGMHDNEMETQAFANWPAAPGNDDTKEEQAADFVPGKDAVGADNTGEEAAPGMIPAQPSEDSRRLSREEIARRYLEDDDENVGEHTQFIRQVFRDQQKKERQKHSVERQKYLKIIFGITIVTFVVGIYALYQYLFGISAEDLAKEKFYQLKTLELEISDLKRIIAVDGTPEMVAKLNGVQKTHLERERAYNESLANLDGYSKNRTEEERLIFHIARTFGECELTMPAGFVNEVKNYIQEWKKSDRLKNAITRAKRYGYPSKIAKTMLQEGLPPQFFYLGLQESNFNPYAVGPITHSGYAKGPWQFIAKTAHKYKLKTGPLVNENRHDELDERFNFDKATRAAAKYLRDIYDTDAQASGFLVMASYNWGEHNINRYIRKMPQNPRERNFWQFLEIHGDRLPKETYNYVFSIISAAVIGENPRLFGFDFDNPLKSNAE